jgi:Icc-related predicted phosphoesterase
VGERYFELPNESDLCEVCDTVAKRAGRLLGPSDRLVLLTHYPPRLVGMRELERDPPNGGLWYDCVRELAETLHPIAIVQGHVHSWAGTSQEAELDSRSVTVFHPGRAGGTLLVDVGLGAAGIEWPT